MGTMTFTDFTSELGFLLGNRTDADATNSARLSRWVNQAYTYMCHPSVHHFREMQAIDNSTALATADNEYSIASLTSQVVVAIRFVVHIEATAYLATAARRRLTPRGIRWLETRNNRTVRPIHYIIEGSILVLVGFQTSS